MALNDAEHVLLGDHFLANHGGRRFALLRRYIGSLRLLAAASWTQCAKPVRYFPDPVLIRDQDVIVSPSESVRLLESLRMALNPIGPAVPVLIAQ